MIKRSGILLTAMSLLSFLATSPTASDWATSEGSCYKLGDKIASGGISVHYIGIYGAVDYGLHDAISVGIGTGFNRNSPTLIKRHNFIPFMVRGAFHPFNLTALYDKLLVRNLLDPYIGISAGWRVGWVSWTTTNNYPEDETVGGFYIREMIGIRYFFSDRMAIYMEDCAGLTFIGAGISYKL